MKKGTIERKVVTTNQVIQHVWIDMPIGSKFIIDLIFLALLGVLGHTFDVGSDVIWCYGLYMNNHPWFALATLVLSMSLPKKNYRQIYRSDLSIIFIVRNFYCSNLRVLFMVKSFYCTFFVDLFLTIKSTAKFDWFYQSFDLLVSSSK